jgi:cytoskeletal protein RodZ
MSTIGQQLRQRREARSLTIDQAASATRIRARYLTAMETGEFELLPSPVHARGFLRAYAEFLDLDAEPLLAELEGKDTPAATFLPSAYNENPNGHEPTALSKPKSGIRSGGIPSATSDDTSLDRSRVGLPKPAEAIFNEVG